MTDSRRKQILTLLKSIKRWTILIYRKLCSALSTLRRDLLLLEKEGLIRRYRGGVVLEVERNHVISTRYRENVMIHEKNTLPRLPVPFRTRNEYFIDSSSTAKALLPYLSELSNSVIITNGLQIAYELLHESQEGTKIYMIGGEAIKDAESVVGDYGNSFLNLFQIDLFILSSTGIDSEGIYEANFAQALLRRKLCVWHSRTFCLSMIQNLKKHAYKLADWSALECIISNKNRQKHT